MVCPARVQIISTESHSVSACLRAIRLKTAMDFVGAYPYISTVLLTMTITVLYSKWKFPRKSNYPPGPSFALPLLGHLHLLGRKPHLAFQKWRRKYGPVFSLKLGVDKAVVISDAELARQVFANPASVGRMRKPVANLFGEGKCGVINSDGEVWADQRRFTVRTLNTLGLAKGCVLEGIIADEAVRLVKFFEKRAGLPIPGNALFLGAVVTSVWTMLTGERNEWDAAESPSPLRKVDTFIRTGNKTVETDLVFFPWLRFVAPKMSGWTEYVDSVKSMEELADEILEQHNMARGCSSDFIEHYLTQIESTTDPSSSFYADTGRKNLQTLLMDLILAGSDTTATTMEYTMLYLSKYKHVQKEVQSELDREIGKQFPNLSDRPRLPYTEAFILETLRRSSILGMAFPHRAIGNIQLGEYTIPANSIILADAYNIHHNQASWGSDSYDFRPERFLNEDKTQVVYRKDLMPFSTGKRMCIGESLANDTLFLFVASLMQAFSVEITDGEFDLNDMVPGFIFQIQIFRYFKGLLYTTILGTKVHVLH